MKILYIGNFTDEGSPLGYCPNAEWISETFRELGHEVDGIDESSISTNQAIKILKRKKYDMLLTEEGRLKMDFLHDEDNDKDILKQMFAPVMLQARRRKIPVVAWLTNLFFNIMRREAQVRQNPIFKADIVFTTDGGHQKEFEAAGVNHVCLRQGIYQKEAYIPDEKELTPMTTEIGFIGAIYDNIWPYRKQLVDWLKDTYAEKFEQYGARGEVRHHELNVLVNRLKIVVGDSVWSPHYWSNRVYEIIGRGGFLIMPDIPGLEKEFTPYQHYIPYKMGNFKQLKEIIDYFLTHDKERNAIRMAGFEHCKKYHTYKHRVKKMLEILEERKII